MMFMFSILEVKDRDIVKQGIDINVSVVLNFLVYSVFILGFYGGYILNILYWNVLEFVI